jgi:hypothetical protein
MTTFAFRRVGLSIIFGANSAVYFSADGRKCGPKRSGLVDIEQATVMEAGKDAIFP